MSGEQYRSRINYEIMQPYATYEVLFVGTVLSTDAQNGSISMQTSDGKAVDVFVHDPSAFSETGIYEIVGRVSEDGTSIQQLENTKEIYFGTEKDFDMDNYNKMVNLTTTSFSSVFMPQAEQGEERQ